MKHSLTALSGLLLLFIPACQAREGDPPSAKAGATSAPVAASLAPTAVIARVNGTEIPARQLDQTVRIYLESSSRDPKTVPEDQIRGLRKQLMDSLVSSEILFQASQKAGIAVSDESINEQLQSLRSRFPSEDDFSRYIAGQEITLQDMRERIRRNLATQELVGKEIEAKLSVSEAEIADYYRKNKDKMRREESVKVSEIFVRTDPKAAADARAKARQKIESLLKEVRGGKEFAALARQFSEAPDARQGGDMGYITRNGTLPAIASPAFRLKVGEVSDVVESPFGYHVLKVTEKKPAGDVKLEEAKPQVSRIVRQQKEREAFNAYLARLKAASKVEILVPEP